MHASSIPCATEPHHTNSAVMGLAAAAELDVFMLGDAQDVWNSGTQPEPFQGATVRVITFPSAEIDLFAENSVLLSNSGVSASYIMGVITEKADDTTSDLSSSTSRSWHS